MMMMSRVVPGARERLVQITGPALENIIQVSIVTIIVIIILYPEFLFVIFIPDHQCSHNSGKKPYRRHN